MKALLVTALLIVAASSTAHAAEKCKFHLNDLTKDQLVATGKSRDDAMANAATKCFNMYEAAQVRRTGHGLTDDDAGVTIVNQCANVRCS